MGTPPQLRLSTAHLDALLGGDWETTGPLRLNERLDADDLSASVLFVNVRRLLETVRDAGGAPVTADGRFTPPWVELLVGRLWWGVGGDPERPEGESGQLTERDVRPLVLTRAALELSGLLVRASDRLVVAPSGVQLLARERGGELYARLFRCYFRALDHARIDGEPEIPTAWRYLTTRCG